MIDTYCYEFYELKETTDVTQNILENNYTLTWKISNKQEK